MDENEGKDLASDEKRELLETIRDIRRKKKRTNTK